MAILDRRKDRFVEDQDKRVSVGIEFPFGRVGGGDGYFKSTKTTVDSIKNNIKLLLQTHRGERVFQPNLGMDLRSLIFEPLTEDITIQIENNIVDVFSRWLPFVDLRNININRKDDLNQVNKLVDSDGNISLNRQSISMKNILQKCFNTSTRLMVWYLILDRFF